MTIAPHLTVDELEQRYRRAEDPVARSQWQILWLLAGGMPTAEVARVTGYSVSWVQEIARRYRAGPAGHRRPPPRQPGRGRRCWMRRSRRSCERRWPDPRRMVGIWTCRSVAAWMSQALGRPVSEQRGWEWMRRLGFTPQRPRPRETRADPAAQEAFKKGGLPPPSPR